MDNKPYIFFALCFSITAAILTGVMATRMYETILGTTANKPGGQYIMRCDGKSRSWANCYSRAEKTCKDGRFNIIQRGEADALAVTHNNTFITTTKRELIIECR